VSKSPYLLALGLALLIASPIRGDLAKALAEPDLEKRSGLALDNAASAFKAARAAYQDSEGEKFRAGVAEVQESVELAAKSLHETGKNPRKSPKWFKRAEINTRDLLRRVESFQLEMAFDDRAQLDSLKARLQAVHEELLLGLMEGKRK
jgi:hypothetical protein